MDIIAKINQANGRLRSGKVGVVIQAKGDRLYLRATFPPKPGSTKQQPYQQRLALGFHANPSGVSAAEAQARKIGALLDCKEFSWNPYLENSELLHTIGSWVERFERQHWAEVIQNQASMTTWKTDYLQVFKNLPAGELLTLATLVNYITTTKPDSRTRKRACDYCFKLAEFAELEGREAIKKLTGNYSSAAVNPRSLPTDAQIVAWRDSLPLGVGLWECWLVTGCVGMRFFD